jgi:hypothetical protein
LYSVRSQSDLNQGIDIEFEMALSSTGRHSPGVVSKGGIWPDEVLKLIAMAEVPINGLLSYEESFMPLLTACRLDLYD